MTFIKMEHPDLPEAEPASVTEEAFNSVWKAKGWKKVKARKAAKKAAPKPKPAPKPEENPGDDQADGGSDDGEE